MTPTRHSPVQCSFLCTTLSQDMAPFSSSQNRAIDPENGASLWGPIFGLSICEFVLRSLSYFPLVLLLVWLPCTINLLICPWVFPLVPANSSHDSLGIGYCAHPPLLRLNNCVWCAGFHIELIAFHIALPLLLDYYDIRSQIADFFTASMHLIAGTPHHSLLLALIVLHQTFFMCLRTCSQRTRI